MASEESTLYTTNTERSQRRIDDIDLDDFAMQPVLKFVIAFLIGGVFFSSPFRTKGKSPSLSISLSVS